MERDLLECDGPSTTLRTSADLGEFASAPAEFRHQGTGHQTAERLDRCFRGYFPRGDGQALQ